MLVLQRKVGESLMIGENIEISIVEITNDKVKIAIAAPKEIPIMRTELIEAANANKEAALQNNILLDNLKNIFLEKKEDS